MRVGKPLKGIIPFSVNTSLPTHLVYAPILGRCLPHSCLSCYWFAFLDGMATTMKATHWEKACQRSSPKSSGILATIATVETLNGP